MVLTGPQCGRISTTDALFPLHRKTDMVSSRRSAPSDRRGADNLESRRSSARPLRVEGWLSTSGYQTVVNKDERAAAAADRARKAEAERSTAERREDDQS